MTDQIREFAHAPASVRGGAEGFKCWLIRELVAEAPSDLDEVTAHIRPLPGWVSFFLAVGVSAGIWVAIIAGVALLLR